MNRNNYQEICALANATGGKILLGVSDKGEIKGINITNRLKSQIADIARNFDPKLEILVEELGGALVINVPEGKNKPYSVNGKFFMRYGPNSQQLERDEIRDFFFKEGLVLWDEKTNRDFDLNKNLNKKAFGNFRHRQERHQENSPGIPSGRSILFYKPYVSSGDYNTPPDSYHFSNLKHF